MGANVLDYLEASAQKHPDSCAVIDEHGTRTYAQLRDASRRVGSALAKRGVQRRPVVVSMEKSADALVAQLGVLYAGGYYVPVDPGMPIGRLSDIARALGGALIVTDKALEECFSGSQFDGKVISFETISSCKIDARTLSEIRGDALETGPAYALFTSGSTGTPKGVVISHRAIMSFIDTFVRTFGIKSTDRIGNQAPFDFDVSTKDIYASFASSATLVIIPRRLFMQPVELVSFLSEKRVTVLIWAVAALCLISAYHALGLFDLSSVRSVLFSGEVMPKKHLLDWRSHLPQATFVNLYGPTEATCNCLYHVLDRDCDYEDGLPIGKPFDHCSVLLVDDRGRQVVEPDVEGEIFVCGPSLALGYLNQPMLTRQSFVQNPLHNQYPDRSYRTGDMAKLDSSGRLHFLGRRDNQVKHQGHRIEIEEVDIALEQLPGVNRCRCAYDAKKKLIHAFYEGPAEEAELASLMREVLPAYMRPSKMRRVTFMPLTKNGKVDRKQLLDLIGRQQKAPVSL